MFTVCPKCALTLVVTAQDLRVAQGYVRCGRCSNVFNALAALTEDPARKAAAVTQAAAQTAPPKPSVPAPSPAPTYDLADADADDARISEAALEFNSNRTNVGDVFVEPPVDRSNSATGQFEAIVLKGDEDDEATSEQEMTFEVGDFSPLPAPATSPSPSPAPASAIAAPPKQSTAKPAPAPAPAPPKPDVSLSRKSVTGRGLSGASRLGSRPLPTRATTTRDKTDKAVAARAEARRLAATRTAEISSPPLQPDEHAEENSAPAPSFDADDFSAIREANEEAARSVGGGPIMAATPMSTSLPSRRAPFGDDEDSNSGSARARMLWGMGSALLVLVLLSQAIHHYRNDLATRAPFTRPLTGFYRAIGIPLIPQWNLSAYEVRQLGASASAENLGQLTIRASLKNNARQSQPLPLLRVTVQDRYGNRIASGDVPPQSYLPPASASTKLLSAGQRIDAEMGFVDPGQNAVGFEIDACLPAPAGGLLCANDVRAN